MIKLPDRLRELRERENLSQGELAKVFDISCMAISNYELSRRNPDLETLVKIANYFGVTTDYLLGRTDENKVSEVESHQQEIKELKAEESIKQLEICKEELLERITALSKKLHRGEFRWEETSPRVESFISNCVREEEVGRFKARLLKRLLTAVNIEIDRYVTKHKNRADTLVFSDLETILNKVNEFTLSNRRVF
ncbi:helix-turn-helix domain-containing protein [Halonatronum saccharophilum]|uniref:helix-turn-helix domain-containing protein n=1 Tax=Halonatronum saccharophilum TaxID=150060 RepID=UPI0004B6E627|nr:helix-turn-helix transcriptional regulator [Halonatronum saccharophilum]